MKLLGSISGRWWVVFCGWAGMAFAGVKDTPFVQGFSIQYARSAELQQATFRRLAVQRDGIVYVLTDRGVARLFESTLALDRSFRPLIGRVPLDLAVHQGEVYYLYEDQLLSNGEAGRFLVPLPKGQYRQVVFADNGVAMLAGPAALALVRDGMLTPLPRPSVAQPAKAFSLADRFYLLVESEVFQLANSEWKSIYRGEGVTTLASRERKLFVGTQAGYEVLSLDTGRSLLPLQTRLPATEVTCLLPVADGLWVGTTRGAFHHSTAGPIDYYASRRWLWDDQVLDLQPDPEGGLLVLTRTGLSKIGWKTMTLADKAACYERKIRLRHIRYGLCAELRLAVPGDPTSAEMIDTDNDGTWSNYYLASQAFHYGATGEEAARLHAWETFAAMERLEAINPLGGFPSRTLERRGFKVSDPERWHPTSDGFWEWKAHTSSDEITAHTLGCAVLYETVARTEAERQRITRFYDKIMMHIVRNHFYLVDVDGQPTLWGRWNPEYVNGYPPTIFDRRLNSAEIIAALQLAYKFTGKSLYREKAFELLERHGYLNNIRIPMRTIQFTPGHIFKGLELGTEWNHSDDLLAFDAYWVLHRFAFSDELRTEYAAVIQDHWEIEKGERNPLWNFVLASTGAADFDLDGALWTLRRYPLDLVDWSVANSHRRDLTRLPANFRQQETAELVPPDERRIMRWNGNPFALDGGDGGHTELAGDEFLLPYWMGRYLRIID